LKISEDPVYLLWHWSLQSPGNDESMQLSLFGGRNSYDRKLSKTEAGKDVDQKSGI
jgi:hypothetical protein